MAGISGIDWSANNAAYTDGINRLGDTLHRGAQEAVAGYEAGDDERKKREEANRPLNPAVVEYFHKMVESGQMSGKDAATAIDNAHQAPSSGAGLGAAGPGAPEPGGPQSMTVSPTTDADFQQPAPAASMQNLGQMGASQQAAGGHTIVHNHYYGDAAGGGYDTQQAPQGLASMGASQQAQQPAPQSQAPQPVPPTPLMQKDLPSLKVISAFKQPRDYAGEIALRNAGGLDRTNVKTKSAETIADKKTGSAEGIAAGRDATAIKVAEIRAAATRAAAALRHSQSAKSPAARNDALKSATSQINSLNAERAKLMTGPNSTPDDPYIVGQVKAIDEQLDKLNHDAELYRLQAQEAQGTPRPGGAAAPTPVAGKFKTDANGVKWQQMSDGTARKVE